MSDKDKKNETKADRAERFVWQPGDLIVHSPEAEEKEPERVARAKKAFGKK